jgi:hypothetical protein
LDIGVLGYIGIFQHKEHPPEVWHIPPGTPCIYSLMMFVIKNREIFDTNKDCYEIYTRHNMNIHMNQVNLAKYGTGVHHMAVRIYNGLPNKLKAISNDPKQFKVSLKTFLYLNSFYTLDEVYGSG